MDIQLYGNCRDRHVTMAVLLLGLSVAATLPATCRAEAALAKVCSVNGPIRPEQAKAYARELDEMAKVSSAIDTRQRLAYEKGLIFFHGALLEEALAVFEAIVSDGDCKGQVRLFSLNMLAQVARLRGREDLALEAFAQLIASLEEHGKEADLGDVHAKLLYSAHLSRGEIYEKRHDLIHAMQEYESLQAAYENLGSLGNMVREKALLADKVSQHYFKTRQFEKYRSSAEQILHRFPEYYRSGLVELEFACLKQVQQQLLDTGTVKEAHQLPPYLVEHLRAGDKRNGNLKALFKDLSHKYRGTYAGVIILYHYAWVLDALEENREAAAILGGMAKMMVPHQDLNQGQLRILSTLREYANLQHAILLSEAGRYSDAKKVLEVLDTGSLGSHLTEMRDTVGEALTVLKREVSPYAN